MILNALVMSKVIIAGKPLRSGTGLDIMSQER